MTIKKTSDSKNPTANLAINKSRIKKYGKNKSIPSYYLEKGQEFQIELYNPTQEKVLTTIKLNNKPISGGLILRPAERVFLDRFLDTNKKFLFDTYKVENTKSTRNAIEPNGDVEIAFFKEIIPEPQFLMSSSGTATLDWMVHDNNITYTNSSGNTNLVNNDTGEVNLIYNQLHTDQDIFIPTRSASIDNNSSFLKSGKVGNIGLNYIKEKPLNSRSLSKKTKSITPTTIETGRVEKGSESDQTLCEGSGDFEITSFHVVRYKLLPKSEKQLSAKDYYTKYCGGCGAKCKTKFCPYCGVKQ